MFRNRVVLGHSHLFLNGSISAVLALSCAAVLTSAGHAATGSRATSSEKTGHVRYVAARWSAVSLLTDRTRVSHSPRVVRMLGSLDSYRSAVAADGPAATWRLDETTGSVASDSSGNGNNGTYTGTYTHATNVAPVGVDNAASFGGTAVASTSVNASIGSALLNTAAGTFNTVELWMYWDGRATGESLFDFASSNTAYSLWASGNGLGFTTGHNDLWGTSSAALANGWHLIDAEFENGSVNLSKLYVDGAAVSLKLISGPNQTVSLRVVGGSISTKVSGWAPNTNSTFSGQLDDVSVFKAALSDSQVANHWNAVDGTPVNNGSPRLVGDFADSRTVTANHGGWTGSPSYAYQWRRCDSTGSNCSDISGATSMAYTPKDGDVGSTLRALVTATNASGSGTFLAPASVPIFPMSAPHTAALQAVALADGPWGFWPLDESTGDFAADASGNNRPLSVVTRAQGGVPRWGSAGAASDATSLHFRGNPSSTAAGDRAFIDGTGSMISQFLDNFTAEAWVKFQPNSKIASIFGFGDPLRSANGWEMARDNSGNLALFLSGGIEVWHGAAIPVNKWEHVALTRGAGGGVWTIYLNGLKVGQVSRTNASSAVFDLFFGADATTGGGFNLVGEIVDGAIYTSVLDAARIRAHARALTPPAATQSQTIGPVGGGSLGVNPGAAQAEPVDTATANFYTQIDDLQFAGTGVPFAFSRTYNSSDTRVGRLGQGWSDSLDWTIATQTDGGAIVRAGSGQQLHFTKLADGTYAADGGGRATLTALTGGGFELVTNDQIRYAFDSTGRLTSETNRNGQGLTLSYDANGLHTITDAVGRVITVSVAGGRVTHVVLPGGAGTVDFAYTNGLLTGVTDAKGGVTHFAYDSAGRLTMETDQTSTTVLTNAYDAATGRVTDQWDARGKHTTFSWDPVAQIATVTDPNGNVWKDVYGSNVLLKQLDGTGKATVYGRDANLGLTSVASPSSDQTTMTYDANGNVLTATAPASLGSVQKTFTYDAKNNVTSVTDAKGNVTTNTYDAAGNLATVKLNNVQIAAYTYNTAGQKLTSTDGNNHNTTYTYDIDGNIASITDPLGNETTYTYDAIGRVLAKVDPLGNVTGANPVEYTTTYTYDAAGHLLTETDPLGHTTTKSYDAAGRLLTTTDPNNHTTTNTYDGNGNLLSVTGADPDGAGPLLAPVTSYTYDDAGNKLTETDPNNHTTTLTYDASNRLLSETTAVGNKTTYGYDANGNEASVTDPRGNVLGANPADYTTTNTYDAAGRKLTSTDPLGHVTAYTYDAVGNCSSVKDANNHTTSYTYDAAGRVLTVTAPDGGVTTYSYDGNGNVATRSDDNNHATTSVYDDAGHRLQVTAPDPDGAGPLAAPVKTSSYDANGNMTSTTDPNGNATPTAGDGTTTWSYDRANRLTSVSYSDLTPSVSYTYDAVGNRVGMTDGGGSVTYTFDNLNRMTAATHGSDVFSYTYDAVGNATSRTFPDGLVTSYAYDGDSQMTSATAASAATTYSYDPAGNPTSMTLPTGNGYEETRVYDRASRLIEIKNAKGTSVLSQFNATLDPIGNPTQIVRSGSSSLTTTYVYDASDRLTSVCYQATCPNAADPYLRWTYDKVGNRLTEARPTSTTTYVYNGLDELTQAGSTAYTYDADGNELSAGSLTFSYDLANRMASSSDGTTTTAYSYDGDGNRTRAASGGGASDITNDLWDTNSGSGVPELALERDGSGSPLRSYVYGLRRISAVSGNASYYHYDLLGSVVDVTSASGSSQWTYGYGPFGTARTATQLDPVATANPMQFDGEYLDSTALYNLRARQYDPTLGRMLSVDPVQATPPTSQTSTYAYVYNRPSVYRDPSGMTAQPSSEGTGAAGAASGPAGVPTVDRIWTEFQRVHVSTAGRRRGVLQYAIKAYWMTTARERLTATLTLNLQWQPANGGWLNTGRTARMTGLLPGPTHKIGAFASCVRGETKLLRGRMDIDVEHYPDTPWYEYSSERSERCV
jgi:RHS repeat-associated protein